MAELLPVTGIFTGGLISNKAEFALVNDALAATVIASESTSFQMASLATGLAGLAVTTTAIALKINTSVRGPAVGVKSTDANFNYNVSVNVLTARNALSGPTDQIPIPPPPVGL
jgi:hypothetical protein